MLRILHLGRQLAAGGLQCPPSPTQRLHTRARLAPSLPRGLAAETPQGGLALPDTPSARPPPTLTRPTVGLRPRLSEQDPTRRSLGAWPAP